MEKETNVEHIEESAEKRNSIRGSCSLDEGLPQSPPRTPTSDGSEECALMIVGDLGKKIIAATGRVWKSSLPTIHNTPLGDENVKVSILVVVLKKALLPIAT